MHWKCGWRCPYDDSNFALGNIKTSHTPAHVPQSTLLPHTQTHTHTHTTIGTPVELGSVPDGIAVILYKEGDPVSHTSY